MTYKVGDVCAIELKEGQSPFTNWYLARIREFDKDGLISKVCVAYEDFDRDDFVYVARIEDDVLQAKAFRLAVLQGGRKSYPTTNSLKNAIVSVA